MQNDLDKPTCNCGIFGIFGSANASLQTYYGLHALQHRGQEASGIVSRSENEKDHTIFHSHKGEGLVSEVYEDHSMFENV